jgi:hypothetical protein
MRLQYGNNTSGHMLACVVTGVLIGAAVITWVIAWGLAFVVAPLLRVSSPVAQSPESLPPVALAAAAAGSGFVLFVGAVVNWFAPRRAIGRAVLLMGGLMVAMSGAVLANDTLESGWAGLAALLGLAGGMIQLVFGLLAWIASLSDWLPGPSLVKHMWAAGPIPPHTGGRRRVLLLTVAVALGWVFCALTAVFRIEVLGALSFFVAVWGMPILAGVLVARWRDTEPNRLQSLGLAAVSGLTLDLLYLLVLGLWYYRFNPIGFAPWWAIMGAIFGATGFALWQFLERRSSKLYAHAR